MKKIKALIFALLFVLSLGLISCDKNKTQDPTDESTIPTDGITEDVSSEPENNDVLDGDFIEDNIPEKEEVEEVNTLVQKYYATTGFDSESIVNRSYASKGLLVVKNDEGHIGFYSLYYNKYLIKPMYVADWLKYTVTNQSGLYYTLKVIYEGQQTIYDSVGNVLYTGNELNSVAVEYVTDYETLYCVVSVTQYNSSYQSTTNYKYNIDGTVETIYDIQSDVLANKPTEEPTEEVEFPFGSQYNDYHDLSEFGLELFVATSNNYYTVYDSNYEKLHTFYIPKEAGKPVVITNKLYYQIPYQLPEDAIEYDYSQGLNKYNVKTFSINLETGEQLEERVEYRIIESEPYNKENSNLYYSILTVQHVNEDKTMGNIASYLVDSNGVFHDVVTNKNLKSFIKIGSNYYNTVTKILYNYDLEEIAYLGSINPALYTEEEYIVGRIDGFYGILDSDAKVVAEFKYDRIITPFANDSILAIKDNVYYRLNLTTGSSEELGVNPTKVNDNLYIFESFGKVYFEGIATRHLTKTPASNETLTYTSNNLNAAGLDASSYIVEIKRTKTIETYNYETSQTETSYEYTYEYVTFVVNPLPNQDSYKEIGTEITKHINVGQYKEDAISLKEASDNALHDVARNHAYYSFTPNRRGYYTLVLPEDLRFNLYNSKDQSVSYNGDSYSGYTMLLDPEETYYFRIYDNYSSTATSYYEFEFGLEDGTNSNYPLFYNDSYKNINIPSYQNVYVEFEAEFDAVYEIVSSNANVGIFVDQNYNSTTYVDGDELTLTAGQVVRFRLSTSKGKEEKVNFGLVVSENQTEGMSLFSALELPTTEEDKLALMPQSYGTYLSYKNTHQVPQVINLMTSCTYTNSHTQIVYNNQREVVNSMITGTGKGLAYIVYPGETIYFELSSFNYTNYSVSAYVKVVDHVGEIPVLEDGVNITLNGPALYRLDNKKLKDELVTLSFQNTNYNNNTVRVFDNKGNVVYSNNTYSITSASFVIDPTLTYFLHIDTTNTTDTVYLTYSSIPLYTIENNSYYPFSFIDGALTSTAKQYDYKSEYKIIANKNVTISFRLMKDFDSSYNSFTIYKNGYSQTYSMTTKTYTYNSINLNAGDTLVFTYYNSYNENKTNSTYKDCVYIKDLKVETR